MRFVGLYFAKEDTECAGACQKEKEFGIARCPSTEANGNEKGLG
jgi:hypothetical protein